MSSFPGEVHLFDLVGNAKAILGFGKAIFSKVFGKEVADEAVKGTAKNIAKEELKDNAGKPIKYDPRVRARGVEDPKSHNFPYSYDKEILATQPVPQKDGYKIFQKPGTMNGKDGVYEIGVTKDNTIDHRFFRPNKNR